MNTYELTMQKGDAKYFIMIHGETLDKAIEHANYWYDDGEKIGPDYTIVKVEKELPCFGDPYAYENAVRKALAHPMKSILAITQQAFVSESDKLDLIKRIAHGTPSGFMHMDTAERDYLIDIMKEVD